jgi:diguanylate cyclase (GGDEF)-like protein
MNDATLAAEVVTDTVTGAYSRALLQPRLDEELARSARTTGSCAVFLFDVDFFKTVNDAYGHSRGDEVLRQLADRVRGLVRRYDVLFRYGGDEFVLLLPDTSREEAVQAALHVTAGVRDTEFAGAPPLNLTISLGVAIFPDDGTEGTELLAVADRRNYLAKRRGRACAVADDADAGADPGSSRLWERDVALAAVQDFATQLHLAGRGALRVSGEPGAGHTRFLAEVGTIARMRGLRVVPVVPGEPVPADLGGGGVLLVADTDAGPQAVAAAVRAVTQRERPPDRLGVAYASTDGADAAEAPLPLLGTAHLTPWTPATLGIWLRTMLRAEPSRTLVTWLYRASGGLPGPATRELARLRARGGLVSTGGGWTVAPALLGRTRHRSSLPTPMTRLVGRVDEGRQVARLLAAGRLVTLAGPGGIGKTRLALAVAAATADDFDDGAVFVPLAETTTPDGVVAALAQALRVPQTSGTDPLDEVIQALADRRTLLVLDNFEQVMDAAPIVSRVLAGADGVRLLVTSRERLRLYGEQVFRVPPLAAPDADALGRDRVDPAEAVERWPALALFEQRARAVDAGYVLTAADLPAVAQLCARLDCLSLAIELAAAWTERWSATELLERLSTHLDTGPGPRDLPERQQTLRGAVDWSFRLLDGADQRLFTELGVFADGCTIGGVLAVVDRTTSDDVSDRGDGERHARRRAELTERLRTLSDKSLLVAWTDAEGWLRWRMLEVVRAYAVERLRAHPDEPAVRHAHAAHYVDFAERLGVALTGPEQANWSARMEREHANVRTAFEWAMQRGDRSAAERMCLGLWRYWRTGTAIGEGREWLDRVLADPGTTGEDRQVDLLYAAAVLAGVQGDHESRHLRGSEQRRQAATGRQTAFAALQASDCREFYS